MAIVGNKPVAFGCRVQRVLDDRLLKSAGSDPAAQGEHRCVECRVSPAWHSVLEVGQHARHVRLATAAAQLRRTARYGCRVKSPDVV
jgi:hypothetical protein